MKSLLIFGLALSTEVLFILMNKEEVGKAFAVRRETLDITQARLAKLSGVSVHTLSNLETAHGNVTLDVLLKVAKTLGYKVTVGV
jgi:transcriptional regulator with XRE-family HTH domain